MNTIEEVQQALQEEIQRLDNQIKSIQDHAFKFGGGHRTTAKLQELGKQFRDAKDRLASYEESLVTITEVSKAYLPGTFDDEVELSFTKQGNNYKSIAGKTGRKIFDSGFYSYETQFRLFKNNKEVSQYTRYVHELEDLDLVNEMNPKVLTAAEKRVINKLLVV